MICLVHFSDELLIKSLHGTKAVVAIEHDDATAMEVLQLKHAIEVHLQDILVKGNGMSGALSLV